MPNLYENMTSGELDGWIAAQEQLPKGYAIQPGRSFIGVQVEAYDHVKHYAGDGWKFHLSVTPEDLPRATEIVMSMVEKHGVQAFKVTTPEAAQKFNDPQNEQAGKQFTLYGARGDTSFRWDNVIRDIELKFTEAGIRPSAPSIQGDRMVPGSRYAGYRNELAHGQLKQYANSDGYLGAEEIRQAVRDGRAQSGWEHNPTRQPDSLQNIDFSQDPEILEARSKAANLAVSEDAGIAKTNQAEGFESLLARMSQEPGAMKLHSSDRGGAIMFHGSAEDLERLRAGFAERGVSVMMETGRDGSGWDAGLRVRSQGFEEARKLIIEAREVTANRDVSAQADNSARARTSNAAYSVQADLREALGSENIKSVTRVEGGYRIEVPSTYSRSELSRIGIDTTGLRRASLENGNHSIVIPDDHLPERIAQDARVFDALDRAGISDVASHAYRVGQDGQVTGYVIEVPETYSRSNLAAAGIDVSLIPNSARQPIGNGVHRITIPFDATASINSRPFGQQQQQQQESGWKQQQQQQQQQRQSFDAQTAEEIRTRQMAEQQRQLAENLARQAAAEPANVEPRVAVDNTLTRMQEPSQGVRVNPNPELAAAQLEIQRQLQAAAMEASARAGTVDAVERRSDDSVGSRLRGAAEAGALEGGIKPAGSHLSAAQRRLHAAIAADPNGRVFDALAQRQAAADGVTAEEAATKEPRLSRANIENPRLPEIAARAAGTGVRNPYGIEQDRTPRILAEPGNARPGGASTASLAVPTPESTTAELRVGQGTVDQLRPTSQLRPEVAEVAPADRNASVDRVINRDAGSVLPVAANDAGVTPRSVNTTAPTAPATAANDGATVTVDSAAVSAAAMAAAAAGSDGVRPVSEPHRTSGANRAMGGAGLAMSTQMIQAIQEKLARGEEVSNAEYIAAGVNVGYSALDTAGVTAIDDAVAGQLGRLAPRLAKVGGPLVQAALAVPMIYSASETGDPKAIGAASFGAIGGIGAGMAGQALIPIPGVGFVVGVVVGEGAAHVGGLAADAMYNEDPAKREAAVKELQQIQRDYIPNPLDPLRAPGATMNLAGAAVSSVGRAVNTIGEVASWGGEQLGGLVTSNQQFVSSQLGRVMPAGAANVVSEVLVAPARIPGVALQAAGTVVSAVGTGVDMVGQGVEAVGHTANRAADETKRVAVAAATETVRVAGRATEEFGRTFTREYQRDPSVRGAARATVAATVDVAERAGNYAVRRANEALDSGRELVSSAGSWLADRTPSWLGGNVGRDRDDDETPARRAPAARRPAAPAAPSRVTISQQALDGLERAGWTKKLDLNGDGQLSVAEVNAAFRKHGITARQADDDRSGTLSAQEISQDLNNAIRSRRAPASGRS